jgi:hypothetical protein
MKISQKNNETLLTVPECFTFLNNFAHPAPNLMKLCTENRINLQNYTAYDIKTTRGSPNAYLYTVSSLL